MITVQQVQWQATPIRDSELPTFRGSINVVLRSVRPYGRRHYTIEEASKKAQSPTPRDDRGDEIERGRLYIVRRPNRDASEGRIEPDADSAEMVALLNTEMSPVVVSELDPATTWERLL